MEKIHGYTISSVQNYNGFNFLTVTGPHSYFFCVKPPKSNRLFCFKSFIGLRFFCSFKPDHSSQFWENHWSYLYSYQLYIDCDDDKAFDIYTIIERVFYGK